MNRHSAGIVLAAVLTFFLNYSLSAQNTITGVVTDSLNNPVPFASVYLSKTTIGVLTDNNGIYSLIIPREGEYEMITSCLGYKINSQIIDTKEKKQTINIRLSLNVIKLNEVTVKSNNKNRRKNYAQFIKAFIGETENSMYCRIINPEDLHLYKDNENNILKGFSLRPLIIENRALGYTISYHLTDFSYSYKTDLVRFSGYNHFQQLAGTEKRNKIRENNRHVAYYGSKMHFMRALFSDSLSKENFKIFECKFDSITKEYSDTKAVQPKIQRIYNSDYSVSLLFNGILLVRYTDKYPELAPKVPASSPGILLRNDGGIYGGTEIAVPIGNPKQVNRTEYTEPKQYDSYIFFSDTLKVFKNGLYYKPYSVTWSGTLTNERLADMLPLDFLPDEKVKTKADSIYEKKAPGTPDFIETESSQVAEKVYLHTDRASYTSGEDIWFKAYVVDPSTNLMSVNTNNLHVELISPDSKIVIHRTLRIEAGVGNGDFTLPDTISSGQYRIRAYTNFMRNYDEQFFFLKEITVVSPYDDVEGLKKPTKLIDNKIDITFFPEGGSLVDNVTSRMAFKAVNALGKGCDVGVKLHTPSGEQIAVFRSIHKGMGYFNIQPGPGQTLYTVVQSDDSTETRASLPQSFPTGVVIRTLVNKDKELILTVLTNEATLPKLKELDLSVNLSSRNLINKLSKIKINSLVNNFLIPLDSIPDGILRVTLSAAEGLPLCERLVFLQKNGDIKLKVTTDKTEYKTREKINAILSLLVDSSFTGTGDFSFSAAEERFTDNSSPWPASIASWFLLESDVRGTIEEPSYYFDPDNKNRLQDLDLLLMTQGWRDFKWKYDSLSVFGHENGFTISGKVKRIVNNNPVEGAKINLGLFSEDSKEFLETKSDKYGSYKFENLFINGITEAIMSSTDKSENAKGRISVDPIKYEPPAIGKITNDTIKLSLNTKDYPSFQQEAIIKLNNIKKYKLSDTLNIGEVVITAKRAETVEEVKVKESRRVYGNPDRELVISKASENYGGDVFSFLSGRVAGVRVVRGQNPYSIYYPDDADVFIREQFTMEKVNQGGKNVLIKRGALILLDGYEVYPANLSSVLTLPMNIVDRIDILYSSPLYGMQGANGIVNIITLTGIRRVTEKQSPNYVHTFLNGYDIPRIFYSPNYDNKTEQNFLPDYRTTLFWEPNILIETNRKTSLQYFNADNPAKISIVVEGITEEGIPVTGKINYDVK